jgi:tetratricopeptide (TPR) repeat protein
MGDYYLYKEDYAKSVAYYKSAIENLNPEQKGEYGEYLGHLGFGQALSGDKQGFETFRRAYQLVDESDDLRPFHKLVVFAGIKLREAKALSVIGDQEAAKKSLTEAEQLGKELAEQHKLPLRLEEAQRLKKELRF